MSSGVPEPAVQFADVCFSYGEQEVLHNVSFALDRGSFVGVVGPNGGGKTTLLRLALGLLRPHRGRVSVFGMRPEHCRGRVGYVMQHMQYDPRFPATSLDIVLMGRAGIRRFGPYTGEDRQRAHYALAQVGLPDVGRRPFAQLSGGQRQRVLIAQALASDPELLLLDEPTANVDSEGERAIHDLLLSLNEHLTIVSVSHNVNMVLRTVTHVLCVNATAVLNPIAELHPDTLARASGGDMAVLHHERSCHVYDPTDSRARPHAAHVNLDEDDPS
jgi:zinc transport system ATP-binding protein